MEAPPRILVFVPYYIPGYKSGGPLNSIRNLIGHFHKEFDFLIITSDRDIGDTEPYPAISSNAWQPVGQAQVYYCAPETMTFRHLKRLISDTPHDLVYLNSFLSFRATTIPLILRHLTLIPRKPVVLAPRGELSRGATSLKPFKKKLFITAGKIIRLWKNILWQASSEFEQRDIIRKLNPPAANVFVASNLPSVVSDCPNSSPCRPFNPPLRLLFLSRISPLKNLDFALRCLKEVVNPATFSIYGPIEDRKYWSKCLSLIKELPAHLRVHYEGPASPLDVPAIMAKHHLFFFPTRGENYGHVISEAIFAGTPVLIADTTPWRNLAAKGIGRDLPLQESRAFAEYIDQFSQLTATEYAQMHRRVMAYSRELQRDNGDIEANRRLFYSALGLTPP